MQDNFSESFYNMKKPKIIPLLETATQFFFNQINIRNGIRMLLNDTAQITAKSTYNEHEYK